MHSNSSTRTPYYCNNWRYEVSVCTYNTGDRSLTQATGTLVEKHNIITTRSATGGEAVAAAAAAAAAATESRPWRGYLLPKHKVVVA